MTDPTDDPHINYSVKELLARQDGKLDSIILSLGGKAEAVTVGILTSRVEALERVSATTSGASAFARWALPILLSVVSIGVAVAVVIGGTS